jgi:histidinol-phosphatase (PHP family)
METSVFWLARARFFFFFLTMLTDYHTHTPLCRHAEGLPRNYVAAARAAGLAEIGFSDHNPMPEPFDDWRMEWAEFPRYLELVAEARESAGGFPVRLSLECDYLEGREDWLEKTQFLAPWDYLIGSVHYIAPGWDVDNPRHLSRWREQGAVEEIWALYWRLYEKCVRSGFFEIAAHPDLAKKFGFRPAGELRRYYEPVIQAFVDSGTVMEVSTAGLRKEVAEIYPAREMLELAFSAGVPMVINSDAHAPGEVGRDFDQALRLVRAVGYTETVRFERRQRKVVPLPETWPVS